MITVVHVITKLEMGGAQENTLYTCEHLDRTRFEVALFHGPNGYYDARARQIAAANVGVVPELVREVSPAKDLLAGVGLKRAFDRLRKSHVRRGFDPSAFIVHTHSSKAGILGRLAAKAAGAPIIVHTIHGFGFFESQSARDRAAFVAAERAASLVTDAFISVSKASIAQGQARGIIRAGQEVALIRSGFALKELAIAAEDRAGARARLGLDNALDVITCVANLKPQKDPLTLVEAFRLLRLRRPGAVLLYAGDGELRREVEAAIHSAGITDGFRLLGWREDVPDLLAAADVIALSSVFEGLPRSAVEGIAARRPVVATRVDGTSEVIRDGRNGYLVEPRDAVALAEALDRALRERPIDPSDVERIEEWDADRMVRAQEALYERLVEQRRGRLAPST